MSANLRCESLAAEVVVLFAVALTGCVELESQPGAYDVRKTQIELDHHRLPITLVIPKAPRMRKVLVFYATGDDGWLGTNRLLLAHMAERGHMIAACDSRAVVSLIRRAEGRATLAAAAAALDRVLIRAKRELGLPDATPTILTGFSRGSNLVVFAAGERDLRRHLLGGIAVALTREADHLTEPDPARRTPDLQVDDKGRLQTYPAIRRLGALPFAVIQSSGDGYVRAAESRRLFGPDTLARRLYEVEAKDHAFHGGHEALLRDLDDALAWIIAHWNLSALAAGAHCRNPPLASHVWPASSGLVGW